MGAKTATPTLDEIIAGREAALMRIVEHLRQDPRIDAVWRGGSIGREEDDVLSDCDLAVIVAAGRHQEVVHDRFDLIASTGDVVLMLDSPQNSHPDGAQVNALYANTPLPTFFDWNIWPPSTIRPTHTQVLFERPGLQFSDGLPYDEHQAAMPKGPSPAATPEYLDRFKLAMLTIVAKFAARKADAVVLGVFGLMREPPPPSTDLPTVIDALRAILLRLAADDLALRECVERYFELVGEVAR